MKVLDGNIRESKNYVKLEVVIVSTPTDYRPLWTIFIPEDRKVDPGEIYAVMSVFESISDSIKETLLGEEDDE